MEKAVKLNQQAVNHYQRGEYSEAIGLLREALEMYRKLFPKSRHPDGHPDLARSINNLALVHKAGGEYARAEPLYREALEMYRKLFPKSRYPDGHPDLARSINNLADLHQAQAEYAKAEPLNREALEMYRKLFPKSRYPDGHPDLATSINNLAFLHQAQGEFARSEPLFREAMEMCRKLFPQSRYPDGHNDLAISINNLADLHQAQAEYAKAEPLYREALGMRRKLFPQSRYPDGHPGLATSINNLADLHHSQGEYERAEPLYREALEMCRKLFPKSRYPDGHPDLAISINNLADLHHSQGEYERAEPLYREALEMCRKLFPRSRCPDGHAYLATSINNLAILHESRREDAQAEPLCREALQMFQALLSTQADTAPEATALNLAASFPLARDAFLSISRRLHSDKSVYDLVWRGKAALTRVQERRHFDLVASRDPDAHKLALELTQARQQLAHALLKPGKDAEAHARLLKRLTEDKEDLEQRLARRLRLTKPAPRVLPTSAELLKALPPKTSFVDLVRYTDFEQDPKIPGEKGERRILRYVAFVLAPGGKPARVELGEAKPIEAAWASWHSALDAGKPDRDAAGRLGKLLWEPLRKHLPANTEAVYLAPDGPLSFVPWAALPGGKPDTILLEDHAVALVPHGPWLLRQLQAKPDKGGTEGKALVVGGIDYDGEPKLAAPADLALSDLKRAGKRGVWGKLPGTERERQQIAALAQKALTSRPLVLSGREAGTASLLKDLPGVRYAHLATHGFFADASVRSAFQVDPKQFERLGLERVSVGARSPLALSGLALAGANLRGDRAAPDGGILTAESLVGLRLDDLRLAVLSACDTGIGEVGGGEGVFGLQRAFHVAGCANVVASLWKVEDDATAALMGLFYRHLWVDKLPPLEALRRAQLYLYHHPEAIPELAKRRGLDFAETELPKVTAVPKKGQHAKTRQWAAFVLSGVGK
jgi:CHAT domain-containing protein/tetratricopeptide (TPR) repeat protein